MVSSAVALLLAGAAQAQDITAPARDAFNDCLRKFMDVQVEQRTPPEEFGTALSQQCAAEEANYRDVFIRRDVGLGSSREQAQEDADLEAEFARENVVELYHSFFQPQ